VIDQDGTPQQLYEEPVNLFVADFIGDANIVKAQILKIDGINANVDIGGIRAKLNHRGLVSGEVSVAIRPQSICLSQSGLEKSIPGTILKAIYLGGHIEYTVDCILGELFVIDNQVEIKHNLDDAVFITLRTRGVSLIPES
jgi:iron(III) transport system ATP-binding protein